MAGVDLTDLRRIQRFFLPRFRALTRICVSGTFFRYQMALWFKDNSITRMERDIYVSYKRLTKNDERPLEALFMVRIHAR